MRILALDYGSKRVGVAVSDELKMIAQPAGYLPATPAKELIDKIHALVREKNVERILVGLPRNMDGSYGPAAEGARAFADSLKRDGGPPVQLVDERLTSAQANRVLIQGDVRRDKRKEKVDQVAAAILLQSFLDCGTP